MQRGSSSGKNDMEYCAYHEDFGHRIGDCVYLKKEIETLVRQRQLFEYVDSMTAKGMDDEQRDGTSNTQ